MPNETALVPITDPEQVNKLASMAMTKIIEALSKANDTANPAGSNDHNIAQVGVTLLKLLLEDKLNAIKQPSKG